MRAMVYVFDENLKQHLQTVLEGSVKVVFLAARSHARGWKRCCSAGFVVFQNHDKTLDVAIAFDSKGVNYYTIGQTT